MKVLIVSDTHGKDTNFLEAVKKEKPIDFIVHLGDICGLEDYVEEVTGYACFAVAGNNDWGSMLPKESIIMLGRHRTLITHGHAHGVSMSTDRLANYAEHIGCDTVMYGHTHVPDISTHGNITVINPGSLTFPRQPGRLPSYIVANINDDGEVSYELKFL